MKRLGVVLLVVQMLSVGIASAQKATVKEERVKMGTYDYCDPDPVAHPEKSIYPYFRHDKFSTEKSVKEWKSVTLENDFIKVVMFPEIGGKVWTAIDKSNGKPFLYNNDVVKFRDIAMCGPWVSGGIEFNFGIIGHAPTTAMPVDYLTIEKPDGSVSCYISAIELLTRCTWQVEVNLQPDKAYFTTNVVWFNSSVTKEPYYQWMNAAIPASNDLQFVYPGTNYIGHEGDLHPFPVENGVDLSWYKNNAFGADKSYHVIGEYSNFFGGYYHNEGFGSVHHSNYDAKLGQKIFLWGQSRAGGIWEDLLTDNAGQYVEVQSGRMYNQPRKRTSYTPFKNEAFAPGVTDCWTEYWYPIHGTKGIAQANRYGALNAVREGDKLKLYFSPVCDLATEIKVYSNDSEIWRGALNARTLQLWSAELPLKGVAEESLKVVVGDGLLVYEESAKRRELHRPKVLPEEFDWESAYGKYVLGEQDYNSKIWERAESRMESAIAQDKYLVPAMHALANLYYKTGRYDKAVEMASRAMSLNAYDAMGNYIYGLAHLAKGDVVNAKDGLSLASRNQELRSASYSSLAGIAIAEKDWSKALYYADCALKANGANLRACQYRLQALRNMGRADEAMREVSDLLVNYPLNHSLRFERYMANPTEEAFKEFLSLVRSGQAVETYQELAGGYMATKSYDEALKLLAVVDTAPMAKYLMAWMLHQQGNESGAEVALQEAEQLDLSCAFPFRVADIPALEWAVSKTKSWRPQYLLALIYHSNLQKERAVELMEGCNDADFAPFYIYRASLREGEKALADLRKAESVGKSWRGGKALVQYYCDKGEWQTAYEIAKQYDKLYPKNGALNVQYALTMVNTGRYAESHRLLEGSQILPYEGATYSYTIYRMSYIYEAISLILQGKGELARKCVAKSKLWPENLGVGKPYDDVLMQRMNNYSLENLLDKCSTLNKAEALQMLKSSDDPLVKEYFNTYKQ